MKNTQTKDFAFKQFKVTRGLSGMPVSTDSVLLGAWCEIGISARILDIGTGTGLLALMCAQKNNGCYIDAIEINRQALLAAKNNFLLSPWQTRLNLLAGNVLTFPFQHKYDTIICNPPYFDSGEIAKTQTRAIARHTLALSHQALLKQCINLITKEGHAWFILPEIEGRRFISQAQQLGWFLAKLCEVSPTDKKPTHRLLIQLTRTNVQTETQKLTIRTNNLYTKEFIDLTQAFYLKM
ncbi:tRNA1(Val) (adenine(37)-N6)-methyltransferase [Vibrio hepatarius]|uniref:tRNA1(Val) (adenine(37)-N6)-methyltransferase n=1 Tax=Vibrio hepatarius TaxID=171383 RepID=UPI001C09895B|nr:methyltransferase [Vibrio hepatarius]MBU2896320.1 methyltransferase [Vibrio hepatarius]